MSDLVGQTIGTYKITERLGQGGMADVYKAFHTELEVYRALKVIRPEFVAEADFKNRFRREAQAVATLRHSNIVQMHDFGVQDKFYYMVMEYVEGNNLKDYLHKHGQIRPFSKILPIIEQVASALTYAHGRGIIHRDIKPANIMLAPDGQVILMDFGIAKMLEAKEQMTKTGAGIGTPAYMAPEQARAQPDIGPPADIYSLGIVLYEMLTGRVPFQADTPLAVMLQVVNDPLPSPRQFSPDIPDVLQGVVLKATAKEATQRYQTAEAMVDSLKRSLAGEADATTISETDERKTSIEDGVAVESTSPAKQRKGWLIPVVVIGLLLVCVLVGLGGVGGFLIFGGGGNSVAEATAVSPVESPKESTPVESAEGSDESGNEPEVQLPTPTPDIPTATPDIPTPTITSSKDEATPTRIVPLPTQPPPTNTPDPGYFTVLMSFGSEGTGPGQFEDARNIAVNNTTGKIYVGEYVGGRVQVFDEEGNFLTQFMVDTEYPLTGMDISRDGVLFVIQGGEIFRYDAETGEQLGKFEFEAGWGFETVDVGLDGNLITSYNGFTDDIVWFSPNGEVQKILESAISGQTGDSELTTRVAVDGTGQIYALGDFTEAVFKFGSDGRFVDRFGEEGDGPGQFTMPLSIEVDGQQRVFIGDFTVIEVFNSDGQYLETIPVQAFGLAINDQDEIFVASRTQVVKLKVNE